MIVNNCQMVGTVVSFLPSPVITGIILIIYLFILYFWERQSASRGEAERDRETQNLKQAPGLSCQHRAQWGTQTPEWRDHDLGQSQTLNQLGHPGTHTGIILKTTFGSEHFPLYTISTDKRTETQSLSDMSEFSQNDCLK